jgi:RNA polymerase-binding transcription factor DksA
MLKKVKANLEAEKRKLEEQINYYTSEDPYLVPDRDTNFFDDDITENEGHDRTEAIKRELQRRLDEVKIALKRVEDGTYGRCSNCQGFIPKERLEAFPAAALCLDCENRQKKK